MSDTKSSKTSSTADAFGFDPQKMMEMNPFGSNPTQFFDAWMGALKTAQQSAAANPWADFTRTPAEVAEFTMNRMRKTVELGAILASARTPNDVVDALSKASSAAVSDYQEMAEKMLARMNANKD